MADPNLRVKASHKVEQRVWVLQKDQGKETIRRRGIASIGCRTCLKFNTANYIWKALLAGKFWSSSRIVRSWARIRTCTQPWIYNEAGRHIFQRAFKSLGRWSLQQNWRCCVLLLLGITQLASKYLLHAELGAVTYPPKVEKRRLSS